MIEDPEITIHYSLAYREYLAGQKLAVRHNFPLFIFHVLVRYCALIAAIILSFMALVNLVGGHAGTVPPVLPFIFLLFLMPAIFWISWRLGFRRLQYSPPDLPKITFQANSTSFSRQIHQMGDLSWLWSATHAILSDKTVVLVAVRKGCFIVIPRRTIPDDQIARLKEFLQDQQRER